MFLVKKENNPCGWREMHDCKHKSSQRARTMNNAQIAR